MTHGSVLVVDDKPVNVTLLAKRLRRLGYEVLEAHDGEQALRVATTLEPDLVLSDVAMPRMDGLELTRSLKQDPRTRDIPIVLVTAYTADETRLAGLEAGADEFLNKPIQPTELEVRVRSLVRLSRLQRELRNRSKLVSAEPAPEPPMTRDAANGDRVLVVSEAPGTRNRLTDMLTGAGYLCSAVRSSDDACAQFEAAKDKPDAVIIDLVHGERDHMELIQRLDIHHHPFVVLVTGPAELDIKLDALDRGAHDYLGKPVVPRELLARLKTALVRSRATQNERRRLTTAVMEAHTDALTGVFNRRFLLKDLERRFHPVQGDPVPFSILMADIDHFKQINDTHGHASGDRVLQAVARILGGELRASDFVARYGGEEFVVVLPATGLRESAMIAERLRHRVAEQAGESQTESPVTISIGVAARAGDDRHSDALLKRADLALYKAKSRGRNRVVQAY